MLVLGRREGGSLTITDKVTGEEIVLTYISQKEGEIKLGIKAGPRYKIVRDNAKNREDKERT